MTAEPTEANGPGLKLAAFILWAAGVFSLSTYSIADVVGIARTEMASRPTPAPVPVFRPTALSVAVPTSPAAPAPSAPPASSATAQIVAAALSQSLPATWTPELVRSHIDRLADLGIALSTQRKCGSANRISAKMGEILQASKIDIALDRRHTPVEQAVQNKVVLLMDEKARCRALTSPIRLAACQRKLQVQGVRFDTAQRNDFLHKCEMDMMLSFDDP